MIIISTKGNLNWIWPHHHHLEWSTPPLASSISSCQNFSFFICFSPEDVLLQIPNQFFHQRFQTGPRKVESQRNSNISVTVPFLWWWWWWWWYWYWWWWWLWATERWIASRMSSKNPSSLLRRVPCRKKARKQNSNISVTIPYLIQLNNFFKENPLLFLRRVPCRKKSPPAEI